MTAKGHMRQAFTLVEVLVAMTLGLLVMVLALSMLGRTRDESARSDEGVAAEREARAVLTQLTADLQSASFRPDSLFEQSHASWPGDRLGIFCLQPPDAQAAAARIGDLCAVHYYLKDVQISGKTLRCLMRGVRHSRDTFLAIRHNQVPALFTSSQCDEPIAFGVLAFEARPQSRNPVGQWQTWDPAMAQAPSSIAVRLVIARHQLAAKLPDAAAWDGCGATTELLGKAELATHNRHLEVYSALIRFGHPALTESGP
ncbi:MAG: prepilin-type N-terminal cleavage/methylation domain-containing protein [Verrucomicrobia bacterium]|nr:MAG: prepilin-type N-terminal cleavage/methylation domain-containing protein [Verrucomicrobiota bacterium]